MAEEVIGRVEVAKDTFNTLWGVTVYDYTYAGEVSDFETLLVRISANRASLIESEIEPVTTIVTRRNTQLEALGKALSELSRAQASFTEDSKPTDTQPTSQDTAKLVNSLSSTKVINDDGTVTKANCEMAIQLVKTRMDKLNNDSQGDMTRLQSLVNKRDDSFNTASSLSKSVSDTRGNSIKNMGQ